MSEENMNLDLSVDPGDAVDESFSLESILAEYKGSAFISGDKKTPDDVLNAQAEQILRDASKGLEGLSEDSLSNLSDLLENSKARQADALQAKDAASDSEPALPRPAALQRETEPIAPVMRFAAPSGSDGADAVGFTDTDGFAQEYAENAAVDNLADEISSAISQDEDYEEDEVRTRRSGRFGRRAAKTASNPYDDAYEDDLYEPRAEEAAEFFAQPVRRDSIRAAILVALGFWMLVFTVIFESGYSVPFGIGHNQMVLTGVLLIMQILAMICALDLLIRGAEDLFRASPSMNTMLFFSCLATLLSGLFMLATKNEEQGIPFSVISVFSLFFAMRGEILYHTGMTDSLRTAASVKNLYGVVTETEDMQDRVILKKTSQTTAGFYRNLVQQDLAEYVYSFASPLLLIFSLVFAILTGLVKGSAGTGLFAAAAMLSVATTFSAFITYPLPFRIAAKKARTSGCAVAGWGGAVEIYDADGALITDNDVFPVGTISLNAVKLFEGAPQNKVITSASSVIYASNSGLSKLFEELMRSQSLQMDRVEEFVCYEGGGIGGVVRGDKVIVGSSGFMNLQGIRVPANVDEKNALFCAINGELMGVFSVSYIPANSVQSALVSMIRTKIGMILAVRDFNVTPAMLQQKFKVTLDEIEYISQETTYRISDESVQKGNDAVAVLCREGLAPFAVVITKGRLLRLATTLMTLVSVAGAVFGLLLMFFLCWNAAFASASAFNAFRYMFIIHVVVWAISFLVRKRN